MGSPKDWEYKHVRIPLTFIPPHPLIDKCATNTISPNQGIQYVTAQKQAPSAIDFLGAMKEAVSIEKRVATGGTSKALRDVLARCVGDYNKMVTKKAHRITTEIKNMVMNLPPSFKECGDRNLLRFVESCDFCS